MASPSSYDVIVVGAGPAGLSIASELSKDLKVLVVDKKPYAEHCTRSWFVPSLVLDSAPDIPAHCHSEGIKRFICDTASASPRAWDARLKGGYRFLDEKALLRHWHDRVLTHGTEDGPGLGSTILYETICYNHVVLNNRVKIATNMGEFEAKLLVDASGYDSPIKKAYNDLWEQETYWWSVYGWLVHHPQLPVYPHEFGPGENRPRMEVGDYLLWGTFPDLNADPNACLEEGRPVMEYEILDEHTSFPMVLYLRRSKVSLDVMRAHFETIINKEDLGRPFRVPDMTAVTPDGDPRRKHIKEIKYGWYPSGGLSQGIAKDRVAFVGDAGNWATPCGWGMGFIVTNYRKYAQNIAREVHRDRLDAATLRSYVKMARWEQLEMVVDQIAAHFLSHVSPRLIDRFISFWDSRDMDFLYCEKLFTLTITMDEIDHVIARFAEEFARDAADLVTAFPGEDLKLLFQAGLLWSNIGLRRKLAIVNHMRKVLLQDWNQGSGLTAVLQRKLQELQLDAEILVGSRPDPQIGENGFDFLDYKPIYD